MNLTEIIGSTGNSNPALIHKAVLWGQASLLIDSIEFFLKTGTAWDVVKIASDLGNDYLIQQIKAVKPEVVILCQEKDASDAALLMELSQIQLCLKVVTVSMESNLMHIYSKQSVIMQNVSDLLAVVEARNFPNHTI